MNHKNDLMMFSTKEQREAWTNACVEKFQRCFQDEAILAEAFIWRGSLNIKDVAQVKDALLALARQDTSVYGLNPLDADRLGSLMDDLGLRDERAFMTQVDILRYEAAIFYSLPKRGYVEGEHDSFGLFYDTCKTAGFNIVSQLQAEGRDLANYPKENAYEEDIAIEQQEIIARLKEELKLQVKYHWTLTLLQKTLDDETIPEALKVNARDAMQACAPDLNGMPQAIQRLASERALILQTLLDQKQDYERAKCLLEAISDAVDIPEDLKEISTNALNKANNCANNQVLTLVMEPLTEMLMEENQKIQTKIAEEKIDHLRAKEKLRSALNNELTPSELKKEGLALLQTPPYQDGSQQTLNTLREQIHVMSQMTQLVECKVADAIALKSASHRDVIQATQPAIYRGRYSDSRVNERIKISNKSASLFAVPNDHHQFYAQPVRGAQQAYHTNPYNITHLAMGCLLGVGGLALISASIALAVISHGTLTSLGLHGIKLGISLIVLACVLGAGLTAVGAYQLTFHPFNKV